MFDKKRSYSLQETAHGFVVCASNGGDDGTAWTARTIDEAAYSIVNDFYLEPLTSKKEH